MTSPTVFIVGSAAPAQVGHHLAAGAASRGLPHELCDVTRAYDGSWAARHLAWRLRGHRPARLEAFSQQVVERVRRARPACVIATGLAPLTREALEAIGSTGAVRLNYLTDDPWNPAHRAPWFLRALPAYDVVCSPREANLDDIRRAGVPRVSYLPFAYNPDAHFFEPAPSPELRTSVASDVLLAGGADADRVAAVEPLIRAGLKVALYGGYWNRSRVTRDSARGFLDAQGLRWATSAAAVCLGLVRRANRDGHAMRTFEVPAMRGCLLAEDTAEHRRLFGEDGAAVLYFRHGDDAVERVRRLLAEPDERERLVKRAHAIVTTGSHTYADRLQTMLECLA